MGIVDVSASRPSSAAVRGLVPARVKFAAADFPYQSVDGDQKWK
jgi:hypothetical protein